MAKTLLFVDAKSRVEYERDKVYVNGKEEAAGDEDKAKEQAQLKAWEKMSEVVSQYTTTFKNMAVLTAAGLLWTMAQIMVNQEKGFGIIVRTK